MAREELLNDLFAVGKEKSLGYLPINTLTNICCVKIEEMLDFADKNKLKSLLLSPDECTINSGAIFLYDDEMLSQILFENKKILAKAKVPCSTNETFIRHIANHFVYAEKHPSAYQVVGKTFNDERFRYIIKKTGGNSNE